MQIYKMSRFYRQKRDILFLGDGESLPSSQSTEMKKCKPKGGILVCRQDLQNGLPDQREVTPLLQTPMQTSSRSLQLKTSIW